MPPSILREIVAPGSSRALPGFVVLLVIGFASMAGAQPEEQEEDFDPTTSSSSAEPPSDVEVIRIKGRGIQAIQTDVPDSVTQFDAAEIEALGAQSIADLATVTPNVEIRTAGATSPTFFVRGVGLSDFSASAAGAVAIYQDEVPINAPAMQLGLLYDLENVDVRRGPQGTGTNRNASGGAIKISSRKPTGELSARLKAEGGKFGMQDYEGFIEAPIVEEMLSARLSFRLRQRDGYIDNGCAGAPSFDERFSVPNPGDLLTRGDVGLPGPPPPANNLNNAAPGQLNPDFALVQFCAPSDFAGSISNQGEALQRSVKDNSPPPQQISFGGGAANRYSIVPGGLPREVNATNEWAARGIFRLQLPKPQMDWLLKFSGSRLDQDSDLGQAIGTRGGGGGVLGCETATGYLERDNIPQSPSGNPCSGDAAVKLAAELDANPWRGDFDRVGNTTRDVFQTSLNGTWDVGLFSVRSITSYDQYDRFQDRDNDFTPDIIFESIAEDEGNQWYQELKFFGELPETPFRWEVGGWYLKEELITTNESITANLNTDSIRDYTQDISSWATYARVEWDFLDDFTLEGGFRWQQQKSDLFFTIGFANSAPGVGQPMFDGSETWSAPTGEISLKYRFREGISVFWKYARGWKPGTWNTSAQRGRFVSAAEPESIDDFEVGFQGRWFEGQLALSGSFFYYNYSNYQVFTVDDEPGAPPTLRVVNAEGAENYGVELETRIEPLVGLLPSGYDGLVLTGRAGWLEATFLEFSTEIIRQIGTIGAIPIIQDFTGNQLPNSPSFSVSGAAEWTFDLGRWGAIIPRYDFAWRDTTYFDSNEGKGSRNARNEEFLPTGTIGQQAFVLHNLRLTYRTPEGNIELSGWVQNISNLAYKQTAFDASAFSNLTINFVNVPRTWGIGVVFNW